MLDADELPNAIDASALFSNPQYWDGEKRLGRAVAHSLGAEQWTAWDVYLWYPPGVEWTDLGLPPPEAALAQAGGVVVGAPGTLPPIADQSALPEKLRGRAVVVGSQDDLEALLTHVAIAKRHPAN